MPRMPAYRYFKFSALKLVLKSLTEWLLAIVFFFFFWKNTVVWKDYSKYSSTISNVLVQIEFHKKKKTLSG